MGLFECCHGCVAPKRYPGCHDRCKEYLEQKALNDARKEAQFKKTIVEVGILDQRGRSVSKALKKRRKGKKYGQ